MKVLICPDSFKGTLDARSAAQIVADAVRAAVPEAETVLLPIADGGEGTVAALCGENVVRDEVCGPFPDEEKVRAVRGGVSGSAVVEFAAAAGLPLAQKFGGGHSDPALTTSYGVGEQIRAALDGGAENILLGLGGSATNDAGCGMAAALGVMFYDENGRSFVPTGGTLGRVSRVGVSGRDPRLSRVRLTAMCDVTSPLYGERGAAYVFAPQKGAGPEQVKILDAGLRHICAVMARDVGGAFRGADGRLYPLSELPGGGAAGGAGVGAAVFLGAALRSGVDAVLDACGFDVAADGADAAITGEGSFDRSSLSGKAVSGVARRARARGIPVIVLAGRVEDGIEDETARAGIAAAFQLRSDLSGGPDKASENTRRDLYALTYNLFRFSRLL